MPRVTTKSHESKYKGWWPTTLPTTLLHKQQTQRENKERQQKQQHKNTKTKKQHFSTNSKHREKTRRDNKNNNTKTHTKKKQRQDKNNQKTTPPKNTTRKKTPPEKNISTKKTQKPQTQKTKHKNIKTTSCEASSKFHRRNFQKRSFRARLPPNIREEASKTIVSCEASSKFHRTSWQKDRIARGFLKISQNKLPKRSFRARLPLNFTEEARKINVSCEASSKFHRTSFQKDRFTRGFLEISQKKLPKRAFRARLPTISTENLHFTTVSCNRPTESHERVHPEKATCAYRYNGVPSKI